MEGRKHIVLGISAGLMASAGIYKLDPSLATPALVAASVFGSTIGSVLPDLDSDRSSVSSLAYISVPIGFISNFINEIISSPNHRGFMHDITFWALVVGLCYKFLPLGWFVSMCGLFVGVISHLVADAFNPSGVRILLFKSVRILGVSYNSLGEYAIWVILNVLCLAAASSLRFGLIGG